MMMMTMRIWVKHTMIHSDAILSNYLQIILGKEQNETPIAVVRRVFCHSKLIHPIKMRIMSHLFSSYLSIYKNRAPASHRTISFSCFSKQFPINTAADELFLHHMNTCNINLFYEQKMI